MIRAVGLEQFFDFIVVGEECARPKPHPEPYRIAMRILKAAPTDSVVFEDSLAPKGARAALFWGCGRSPPPMPSEARARELTTLL